MKCINVCKEVGKRVPEPRSSRKSKLSAHIRELKALLSVKTELFFSSNFLLIFVSGQRAVTKLFPRHYYPHLDVGPHPANSYTK